MAILDFNAPAAAPSRSSGRMPFMGLQNPQDRPKAQLWLNYGYVIDGSDKFINLPLGLPVDTMDAAEVRGTNPDWIAQRQAQNGFLKQLQGLGATLQPGEDRIVTEQRIGNVSFQVRLRRVNEENAQVATNELSIDLSQLLVANG